MFRNKSRNGENRIRLLELYESIALLLYKFDRKVVKLREQVETTYVKKCSKRKENMKREFLKALGIEDTAIDQIMNENGKDINNSNEKIKTLETEVNNIKELLTNANNEIASYKDMDIDAIKQNAEEYKTKYETAEKDYQAKLSQMEYDNKLDKYVDSLNVKNDIYKGAIKSKIVEKQLKFDGETLLGADDLVKGFKETYADAFVDATPKPTFAASTQGQANPGANNDLRLAMGLKIQE